ncbi:MAG: hypothetical protein J6C86_07025 [Bacteroidaceae bacterium]|nr:hypothetical protein [Bacteroidaceae bacterium]
MKKLLILFALPLFLFGCKANYPVAQQSGKEDMAFLLFVSSKEYAGKEVQVTIDDAQPFTAKVVKQKKANRKGTQYGVSTGTRVLKVSNNGKTMYQKKLFLSTQEVKQIILP